MRTLNRLTFAGLLVFAPLITIAADDDAPSGELDVTIHQGDDKTIQGHHANSFLYAIKTVPKYGKSYFLVRADGSDGNFIHPDQLDKLIPQWEILN